MGNGRFDDSIYSSQQATRAAQGIDDFAYSNSATAVHESLDPRRINNKVFHILESRDSVEHPISTPVIVAFDVTGSNAANAAVVQKLLPQLMAELKEVVDNPQIAIWAVDDYKAGGAGGRRDCLQMGEFESDNRIDEAIRNVWITSNGGGNNGESYDLVLYGASRKTITDSWEKRHQRGLLFIYADELFREVVMKREVKDIFEDDIERDLTIQEMVAEVTEKWEVFVLWPSRNGEVRARQQYEELFGENHVIALETPQQVISQIKSTLQASPLSEAAPAGVIVDSEDITSREV